MSGALRPKAKTASGKRDIVDPKYRCSACGQLDYREGHKCRREALTGSARTS